MDSFLNRTSLYMIKSRNVVSFSDISALNLWYENC